MQDNMAMSDQVIKRVGKNIAELPVTLKGWFELLHIRDGIVIDKRIIPNTVCYAGFTEVAGLFNTDQAGSYTAFDYIAIGPGTTAADPGDTTLVAEIVAGGGERRGGADVAGTLVTTTNTNDTSQWVTTYSFTASFAVTESGVLNAAAAGTLLCRQTFSPINVASGDSLQVTWKVQCS